MDLDQGLWGLEDLPGWILATIVGSDESLADTPTAQRPRPRCNHVIIDIQKRAHDPMGLVLTDIGGDGIKIGKVRPEGAVARWNDANPEMLVEEGDVIVAIEADGTRMDGRGPARTPHGRVPMLQSANAASIVKLVLSKRHIPEDDSAKQHVSKDDIAAVPRLRSALSLAGVVPADSDDESEEPKPKRVPSLPGSSSGAPRTFVVQSQSQPALVSPSRSAAILPQHQSCCSCLPALAQSKQAAAFEPRLKRRLSHAMADVLEEKRKKWEEAPRAKKWQEGSFAKAGSFLHQTVSITLSQAVSQLRSKKPQFDGRWTCVETWGLDDFLAACGVGSFRRLAATSAPWPTWNFTQDGDHFHFVNETALGDIHEEFLANGEEYTMLDGWQQTVICRAFWEEKRLVITRCSPQGKSREERWVDDQGTLHFILSGLDAGMEDHCWGRKFVREGR